MFGDPLLGLVKYRIFPLLSNSCLLCHCGGTLSTFVITVFNHSVLVFCSSGWTFLPLLKGYSLCVRQNNSLCSIIFTGLKLEANYWRKRSLEMRYYHENRALGNDENLATEMFL